MLNLSQFETHIRERGLNVLNVRVLQSGKLVGKTDFAEDTRRLQHSVSKSFTCMAVGLAIQEGKLSLDSTLRDVFPDYVAAKRYTGVDTSTDANTNSDTSTIASASTSASKCTSASTSASASASTSASKCTSASASTSANDKRQAPDSMRPEDITLLDLLRMSTGHDSPPFWVEERLALKDKDWVEHYLSLPLDRPSGEKFTYSSGDTFIISAMVQASVGQSVQDYLIPHLFAPLGINNVEWETTSRGITLGCAGLEINTEELSRFGQLLLQKGMWQGQQLIPEAWVNHATKKQIESDGDSQSDWGQGYGFQFWCCTHNAYRADGAHGQFCIVLPDLEAVIAINSDEDNTQAILDTVWEDLWPLLYFSYSKCNSNQSKASNSTTEVR